MKIDVVINSDLAIREAMKILDKVAEKCLLVVDGHKKLLGTLTDGDLRRSILSGVEFSEDISDSYKVDPVFLVQNQYTIDKAEKILNDNKIDLLPIVDKEHKVLDYLTLSKINKSKKINNSLDNVSVVIMAGGEGVRMRPFTNVLPKPLVPIHGKPIIEHIIERFTKVYCSDFHLTVNYKRKILKAYFEELQPKYDVSFVDEDKPLGTAGSLQFLRGKFKNPFFVTNCDIIVKTNYVSLYEFHKKGGYDISLVASNKEYIIPYGTCELDGNGCLSHINEKPKYNFLINTGLYVLNPDILNLIPNDKFYHITHLIEDAKNQGKKVGVFPVNNESWVDVGQWTEYKKAIEIL
jgi:dTDP-glucose pyrophosphorylase/predicted transcriptional regulator